MNHLEGKVVIITGAGSGFGQLVSVLAAKHGAKVVGADVSAESLAATATLVEEQRGTFESVVADVRAKDQVDGVARTAIESFGAIDVLINNAGIMPLAFFSEHERAWEAWDRCIDVNLKGVVHGISAVFDQMMEQGRGHVVNLSSIYGNGGVAGSGVYSATKAAINVLSDSLRIESQGRIKVTVIKPTGVPGTRLGAGMVNPDALVGLAGPNLAEYRDRLVQQFQGTLPPEHLDVNDTRYASVTPEQIAEQILYAINQPWGVSLSEITIRATGELFVL